MRPTLANATFISTLCLVAGMAILILAAPDAPLQDAWGFRGGAAVLAVAFGGVGALVALRVPGNLIGALLVAIGFWAAAIGFSAEYAVYGLTVAPGSVPFALAASWLATWVWVPFAGLSTTFLVLVFPDGQLLSPRWKPVAWLAAVAIAVTSAAMALLPGPINNVPTSTTRSVSRPRLRRSSRRWHHLASSCSQSRSCCRRHRSSCEFAGQRAWPDSS